MNTGNLFLVLVFVVLYIISTQNYLLFHSLVELVSVVIAVSIFSLAWNTRRYLDNSFLLFVGVAYLFIGGLDLLHTIAYKGMGVLADSTANPATQLWIAARYLQSFSLLVAPYFLYRRIKPSNLLVVYGSISALLAASIMLWKVFPDCFIDGQGLTAFKINSEYLISLLLLCSIALFIRNRGRFEPDKFQWFILAIFFTMASELAFTFYVSVYGFSNLIGHFCKLISTLCIYRALVVSGLRNPYDDLKRNNERLASLLANSTEAIYCIELRRPLDINLPEEEQIDHIYKYAFVSEANDVWARIAGLEHGEELIGSDLEEIMPRSNPQNMDFCKEMIRARYRLSDFETVEEYRTGVKIYATNYVNGIIENGHLLRIWGTGRDITKQKRVEKDLRMKENAIASSLNGIGITDLGGRITYVNDALVRMWGFDSSDEILGRQLPEFWEGDGGFATIKALQEEGHHQGEDTGKRKDGSLFDVQFAANIIEEEDGNPAYMSASFLDVTSQKQTEKDLSHLAGRLITVQEEERRRLARELHDDLTQRLAELAINAGKLKMEAACSSDAAIVLESMQHKLVKVSEDVHAISRQLHPSIIEDLGLVDGLSSECDNFARRTDIQVNFEHDNFPEKLPHDIAICLFRIAQEGLRNVGKHAQTDGVQVRLTRENGEILLVVSDDGTGFDPQVVRKKPGLGLASMRERIRLVGGTLAINSRPGQGCEVRAWLKYN